MNQTQKAAFRAAMLIRQQLLAVQPDAGKIDLPEDAWRTILWTQSRLALAQKHRWYGAVKLLCEDLADAFNRCQRGLTTSIVALEAHAQPRRLATVSEIYQDLLAIQEEFDQVKIEPKHHSLSAVTDSIVLWDIPLGRFEIQLDLKRLVASPAYRVEALEANPATSNHDITHPHVQDGYLCEGEGRVPIQAALREGRLLDFFLLVSQVLHTYAQGSAYVELNVWDGVTCNDCGASVSQDESYCCQRCGSELCDECRQWCAACEESFCSGCLDVCAACGCEYCSPCLATCPVCRKWFCEGCRQDGGLCRACHDKQHQEDQENDPSPTKTNARAARQPAAGRRRRAACASA